MNNFTYGGKYSFNTNAPFILGTKCNDYVYCGTVTYSIANRLGISCDTLHREIYHLLPKGTPDDASLYKYHVFLDKDENIKVLADPWIAEGSVRSGEKLNITITIKGILNDDLKIIKDSLASIAYTEEMYTVTKTKSLIGSVNSIYEMKTGDTPIGGGLDDNPPPSEWEEDDGNLTIATPMIIGEFTSLNPYNKITASNFTDVLKLGLIHSSTKVVIAKDIDFNEVVNTVEYTTDLTKIRDIGGLVNDEIYYLKFKYISNNNISSKWSDAYRFKYDECYTAISGRRFKRHISNKGTIMEWIDKDNMTHKTLILDAIYRNKYSFIKDNVDFSPIEAYTKESLVAHTSVTDAELISNDKYFEDVRSSYEGTSFYLSLDDRSNNACGWANRQALSINGSIVNASLPNIQIAERIMADKKVIDELDPTAATSKHNLYVDTINIWSTSRYDNNRMWTVGNFVVNEPRAISDVCLIVPIIELS